jgi:hypothetical protein
VRTDVVFNERWSEIPFRLVSSSPRAVAKPGQMVHAQAFLSSMDPQVHPGRGVAAPREFKRDH